MDIVKVAKKLPCHDRKNGPFFAPFFASFFDLFLLVTLKLNGHLGHIDAGYRKDDEKTWHTTIMCSLRALEDCTIFDGTITIESIKSMTGDLRFATDRKKVRQDFQRLNSAFVYPKRILNIERPVNSTSYYSIPENNPWPDHKVLKYTQVCFQFR